MKVPIYIKKLIERRARLAACLNYTDHKLGDWLEKNCIDVEEYDVYGGCEMYVNPQSSADRIIQAIENK